MTTTPSSPGTRLATIEGASYSLLSTRPLHIAVFLLPLIVAYEAGSVAFLTHPRAIETIGAHSILGRVFATFGSSSLYLPGIALLAVLLVWHMLLRDPWRLRASTLLGMLLESVLWTLPLLVLALVVFADARGGLSAPPAADAPGLSGGLAWTARLTLSIGAGIYEELLFRLMLLTGLHFLVVDVFRASNSAGCVVAAIVSAVAFALYHRTIYASHAGPQVVQLRLLGFYTLAGLYFATLFLVRGFGVAVAVHALYDVVVLVVIPQRGGG